MPRFNYTNRKSEGLKLGQIVAKDLRKKAKTLQSKADKQPESTTLELDISGKKIDDEGLFEIISALEEVAHENGGGPSIKIEELNFSQNVFTTKSLARLASVIRAAQFDLRALDLSNNKISVQTDAEAHDWEVFWESFRYCFCLRIIDISGNDLSGPRAFEILARVYSRQIPTDPTDLKMLSASVISVADSDTASMNDKARALGVEDLKVEGARASRALSSARPSMSQGTILTRRRGLRSVPFLVFRDVSLTTSGALFLSYILSLHYFPEQLTTEMKAAPAESKREEYSQEYPGGKGIVYLPAALLTKSGVEVLESGELARAALLASDDIDSNTDYVPEMASLSIGGRRASSGSPHKRRASGFSTHSSGESGQSTSELDSKRYKVQRTTIEEIGAHQVQLWSASLIMLVKARAILFGTGPRFDSPISNESSSNVTIETPVRRASIASSASPSPLVVPYNTPTHLSTSYLMAGSASSPSDSASTVTDVTNGKSPPKAPTFKFIRPRRSSTSSRPLQHSNLSTEITQADIATEADGEETSVSTRDTCLGDQKQRMERLAEQQGTDGYRDSNLPRGLPLQLWQSILAQAADAGRLLNKEQQASVVRWAQDPATLAEESRMLGKSRSMQIWKVLDGVGCLAYEIGL
ncbi:MAG: hypothetical protein M1822_001353 [Bathelium mastoideum]|nr:MAG: hypothetical protein M1822_001353 [Bathelium mastoideum]